MLRVAIVFAIAAAAMLFVFSSADKYATKSAIPRYCADQPEVIKRVELILTKGKPVGDGPKRPFIVAAKLIFLLPQHDSEDLPAYLKRLQQHLDNVCT